MNQSPPYRTQYLHICTLYIDIGYSTLSENWKHSLVGAIIRSHINDALKTDTQS